MTDKQEIERLTGVSAKFADALAEVANRWPCKRCGERLDAHRCVPLARPHYYCADDAEYVSEGRRQMTTQVDNDIEEARRLIAEARELEDDPYPSVEIDALALERILDAVKLP